MKITVTPEIVEARAAVELIIRKREQIRAAIEATKEEQKLADADIEFGIQVVGRQEAATWLQEGDNSGEKAADNLRAARERRDRIGARLIGLNSRLTETDDEILRIESVFSAAYRTYKDTVTREFGAEYAKAVERFAEVVKCGAGLAEGFCCNWDGLLSIMLPSLEKRDLRVIGEGPWRKSETAIAARNIVEPARMMMEDLATQAAEIRGRRGGVTRGLVYRRPTINGE